MKKTLLSLACMAMLGGTMNAQIGERFDGSLFHKSSPNGEWLVENNNGTVRLYNRVTKKDVNLNDPNVQYYVGGGNCLLDDGTLCIANEKGAALLKDSVEMVLENPSGKGSMGLAHAATSDGKRVVGILDTPEGVFAGEELMAMPALWEKNAEGVYKLQNLPFPKKDFTGREPQYVTAYDISDDGKTIIGQIQDYTGFYTTMIVWKEGADGKWSYTTPGAELIYDASKVNTLPECPVMPKMPDAFDFMSQADSVAYEDALALYNERSAEAELGIIPWDSVPAYPEKNTFISDSVKAEDFAQAEMDYMAAEEKYWTEYTAFDEALMLIVTGSVYEFNNAALSRNGKYMLTSVQSVLKDPNMPWGGGTLLCTPYRFDLTAAKVTPEKIGGPESQLASSIADNGLAITVTPAMSYTRNAYVSMPGDKESVPFLDYLRANKKDEAAKFLVDNFTYTFSVEAGVDSLGNPIYQEVADSTIAGTMKMNGDGTVFVGYINDEMTNPEAPVFRSFVIDLTKKTAIDNVVAKENEGVVLRREYYNLQGQRIAQPVKGIYLEKVTTTNGVYTKKVLK